MNFSQKTIPGDSRLAFSRMDFLIMVGTIVVLGLLLFIARRPMAARISCINNLKGVGLGALSWAIENDGYPAALSNQMGTANFDAPGDAYKHFQALGNEIGSPKVLICPKDTSRAPAIDFTNGFGNRTLSYFISLDAREQDPSGLLAGDRNLSTNGNMLTLEALTVTTNTAVQWTSDLHHHFGNVVLADGSAMQLSLAQLRDQIRMPTNRTQRLLFP